MKEQNCKNSKVRELEGGFLENYLFNKYYSIFVLFLHLTQIKLVAKVEKNLRVPKNNFIFAANITNHHGGLLIKHAGE